MEAVLVEDGEGDDDDNEDKKKAQDDAQLQQEVIEVTKEIEPLIKQGYPVNWDYIKKIGVNASRNVLQKVVEQELLGTSKAIQEMMRNKFDKKKGGGRRQRRTRMRGGSNPADWLSNLSMEQLKKVLQDIINAKYDIYYKPECLPQNNFLEVECKINGVKRHTVQTKEQLYIHKGRPASIRLTNLFALTFHIRPSNKAREYPFDMLKTSLFAKENKMISIARDTSNEAIYKLQIPGMTKENQTDSQKFADLKGAGRNLNLAKDSDATITDIKDVRILKQIIMCLKEIRKRKDDIVTRCKVVLEKLYVGTNGSATGALNEANLATATWLIDNQKAHAYHSDEQNVADVIAGLVDPNHHFQIEQGNADHQNAQEYVNAVTAIVKTYLQSSQGGKYTTLEDLLWRLDEMVKVAAVYKDLKSKKNVWAARALAELDTLLNTFVTNPDLKIDGNATHQALQDEITTLRNSFDNIDTTDEGTLNATLAQFNLMATALENAQPTQNNKDLLEKAKQLVNYIKELKDSQKKDAYKKLKEDAQQHPADVLHKQEDEIKNINLDDLNKINQGILRYIYEKNGQGKDKYNYFVVHLLENVLCINDKPFTVDDFPTPSDMLNYDTLGIEQKYEPSLNMIKLMIPPQYMDGTDYQKLTLNNNVNKTTYQATITHTQLVAGGGISHLMELRLPSQQQGDTSTGQTQILEQTQIHGHSAQTPYTTQSHYEYPNNAYTKRVQFNIPMDTFIVHRIKDFTNMLIMDKNKL